jgi:hypothetical protein
MESSVSVTQLRADSAEDALSEFVSQRIIENLLGKDATPWSEGAPNRRVFGPEMNEEFVGTWDFTITGGDNVGISGQLIETVDQAWELPEDEI